MSWAFNFKEGLDTLKRPRNIVRPQNTNMLKQINIQLKMTCRPTVDPDYTHKHRHRPKAFQL